MSLITTAGAKYCNIVDAQYENVLASNLRVGGVNGKPWQTARLATTVTLGNQRLAEREMAIQFALMQGERYKIIIGMDIIRKYGMTVDGKQDVLRY